MAYFADLLSLQCTRAGLVANSKKRMIELAADIVAAATPPLKGRAVFDALMARERLGSTALGEGVALPHCRLPGLTRPVAGMFRLDHPIPFEAIDEQPVDLVVVLLVPDGAHQAHLDILAMFAGALADAEIRATMRAAADDAALLSIALSLDARA